MTCHAALPVDLRCRPPKTNLNLVCRPSCLAILGLPVRAVQGCMRMAWQSRLLRHRLIINIKTGIFEGTDLKVHLGQAWRIEFSYGNIAAVWTPS
jgi:hypothetical protein